MLQPSNMRIRRLSRRRFLAMTAGAATGAYVGAAGLGAGLAPN